MVRQNEINRSVRVFLYFLNFTFFTLKAYAIKNQFFVVGLIVVMIVSPVDRICINKTFNNESLPFAKRPKVDRWF